ncbi:hypothetical protein [Ruminococcus bromii]|uniref:DUF7666 domain-containing protein n=1 Tax=Ruminococcus bromii TaxID=40518 RepID=UPI003A909495
MSKVVKSYKGFNKDMTCRGFQYEEGKEYETSKAIVCNEGFHACEYPLDCLGYYSPNTSVYHEVEQTGEFSSDSDSEDSKIASTKIKIGAKLSIAGLVQAAIDFTKSKTFTTQDATGDKGASSATGDYGASSAAGDYGASSATGDKGASSATGYKGASSATGYKGASSATGYKGASSATGDYGASSATGYYGASSATGNYGASSATGYKGASSADNPTAVAVAWGYESKAKGCIGAHIVCAEWKYDEFNNDWVFVGAKMSIVDGVKIKSDTYYTLQNGKFVEVEE